jgi:hypothetical protein
LRRDGQPYGQRRATAQRADNGNGSAERLDTVLEAKNAGAAVSSDATGAIDATDSIVAYLQCQYSVLARGVQLDDVRVGVLCRVGQDLGGDVVGGSLDRRRHPLIESNVEVDGDAGTTCERPQCGFESCIGQDRGMDAARDLSELVRRLVQPLRELSCDARHLVRRFPTHPSCAEGERDQPVLDSVVEISLDPTAYLVARGDDPSA